MSPATAAPATMGSWISSPACNGCSATSPRSAVIPANVTIVGQSAGSTAVALLQASPAARGLFTKVVGMSGSPFGEPMRAVALEQGEAAGLALAQALGASSIEDLRDIGGDRIVAAPVRTPIVVDGRYVIGAQQAFESQQHSDVPIMIGFTRDESFRSLGPVASVAELEAAVRPRVSFDGSGRARGVPRRTMPRAPRARRPTSAAMPRSARRWRTGLGRRRNSAARRRTRTSLRGGNRTRRASRSSITIRRRPVRITRPRFRISCALAIR